MRFLRLQEGEEFLSGKFSDPVKLIENPVRLVEDSGRLIKFRKVGDKPIEKRVFVSVLGVFISHWGTAERMSDGYLFDFSPDDEVLQ